MSKHLYPKIAAICQQLEKEYSLIPAERKEKLLLLREYIFEKIKEKQRPQLTVICTHNSRRSHLGQLWLAVGADYYGVKNIQTFSGGTEATALNKRVVVALQKKGFEIDTKDKNANPTYNIKWSETRTPYQAFSKKYNEAPNPQTGFAAIMVCSEADKDCPVVTGCDYRIALPFDDPKHFDGAELEQFKYTEAVNRIGREMLFVLCGLKVLELGRL